MHTAPLSSDHPSVISQPPPALLAEELPDDPPELPVPPELPDLLPEDLGVLVPGLLPLEPLDLPDDEGGEPEDFPDAAVAASAAVRSCSACHAPCPSITAWWEASSAAWVSVAD
jgi:hypothetical protein